MKIHVLIFFVLTLFWIVNNAFAISYFVNNAMELMLDLTLDDIYYLKTYFIIIDKKIFVQLN